MFRIYENDLDKGCALVVGCGYSAKRVEPSTRDWSRSHDLYYVQI